jgi:hypothetical protein
MSLLPRELVHVDVREDFSSSRAYRLLSPYGVRWGLPGTEKMDR